MSIRIGFYLSFVMFSVLPKVTVAEPIESFTASQVSHGQQIFSNVCSKCHGSNPGNPYSIASFKMRTLGELYSFISTKMPANDPGSMSDKDYADVLALLLSASGRPAGQAVLTPEQAKTSVATLQP
ncbi:cytochrome c [Pseudomonas pergaminensis]|uniref:c-type cytochrome n=1 Tax=Pseudomonas pergaminensis TaxID=2853159 RepID=UPI0034D79817